MAFPTDDSEFCEYYLSAYLAPPGPNAFISLRHNHCVALWARNEQSIELLRYWELERLSGIKHHATPIFGERALSDLLNDLVGEEGLKLSDITEVWGTPGIVGFESFPKGFEPEVASFHSLSHLWSGFLSDSEIFRNETIVGLAMDGGPDFDLEIGSIDNFYAGGVSQKGQVHLRSVASPAVLFKAAHRILGLEPGSLMAVATASLATVNVDLPAAMEVTLHFTGAGQYGPAFELVQQLTDDAEAQLGSQPDGGDLRFSRQENVASAVGKIIQTISEQLAIQSVSELLEDFNIDPTKSYLAMSGGFALNCPTNSLLMNHFGFRGLLAPPCANDGGQALGIGLLAFHHRGDFEERTFRFDTPFYGRQHIGVDEALKQWDPWIESVSDFDESTFVNDVTNDVIAWVDGAAEIGPRSLGHRSLLGDPRATDTKDRLNEVKQRQWWRPVAPIVLEEHVDEWFVERRPSPFMLEVFQVRSDRKDLVPAIMHLDDTARVQTLSDEVDSRLTSAIRAFARATGVAMLCNTSLNDKGEPIVDDASQALNFCVRKGVNVAYLEGRRVRLRQSAEPGLPDRPEPRRQTPFQQQVLDEDVAWAYWDSHDIEAEELFAIARSPELRRLLRSDGGLQKVADELRTDQRSKETPGLAAIGANERRSFRFDGSSFVNGDLAD